VLRDGAWLVPVHRSLVLPGERREAGRRLLLKLAQEGIAGLAPGHRPLVCADRGTASQPLQGLLAGGTPLDVGLDRFCLGAAQPVGQQLLQQLERRTARHGGEDSRGPSNESTLGAKSPTPIKSINRSPPTLPPP